jgi:predicted nucleotidyltransferase
MIHPSLQIQRDKLEEICRKYHIRELCVFGSATREDFGPESDVDLLVEFEPGQKPDLFLEYPDLLDDLHRVFGREVDVVDGRNSLINPFRRAAILRTLEPLYAA